MGDEGVRFTHHIECDKEGERSLDQRRAGHGLSERAQMGNPK